MAMDTAIKARDTLKEYLFDIYDARRRKIRKAELRNYSQKEFAEDVGMVPNTMGRYLSGDIGVTLDQAVILLRHFGPPIVHHFIYSNEFDQLTAEIIATLPTLDTDKQRQIENIIRNIPTEEDSGAANGNLVKA